MFDGDLNYLQTFVRKGGLFLTRRDGVLHGGQNGPAVSLDKPDSSLLLEMISYRDDDHKMPPDVKLPAAQAVVASGTTTK